MRSFVVQKLGFSMKTELQTRSKEAKLNYMHDSLFMSNRGYCDAMGRRIVGCASAVIIKILTITCT